MALDTRYIPLNFLQQYFVDLATGLPLAGGIVTFYKDQARTQLKNIYQISGTPPNYTYTALPNPLTLSANGTFVDASGNDISVYAFPYDSAGAVELYFVTVYSNLGVFQFSREGLPNTGAEGVNDISGVTNYIPNGQFLLHNNVPATLTTEIEEIVDAITIVAPGGWTFERAPGSTAKDYVKFTSFGSYITNPPESPRYEIGVRCEHVGTGSGIKGLRLKFNDVNKFASDTQQYTLSFFAKNNSGSSTNITLREIKNYGTSGSPTDTIDIPGGVKLITNTWSVYNVVFTFGNNTGKTIGSLNDDYVQLEVGFLPDDIFDVSFTDFVLIQGAASVSSFPVTTNGQFTYRSAFGTGPTPGYDGENIGLPIICTKEGFGYDTSIIGKVFPAIYDTPEFGELTCDGFSYEYDKYSIQGIPYSRLGDKLWDHIHGVFKYGTGGGHFITTNEESPIVRFINNDAGAVATITDGANPTGFTFFPIHVGTVSNLVISFLSYGRILVKNLYQGYVTLASAGTSGFTISSIQAGTTMAREVFGITVGAMPGAGTYFSFYSGSSGAQHNYCWFNVGGAGSDPAPFVGNAIRVNLHGTESVSLISQKIREALNGWQNEDVTVRAGNVITPNSYFLVNAVGNAYYVWYAVDGAGTDPLVSGHIGIKVSISSTDTIAAVAFATMESVNHKYYAVPDFRGMFLRGFDPGVGTDPEAYARYNFYIPSQIGGIGSNQLDDFLSHGDHVAVPYATGFEPTAGSGSGLLGGIETRPVNSSVNYVIKY